MGEDGARDKDWLRARGASPVSYRHNFLIVIIKEIFSNFKGNSRTNCTFLEFQEFSRTKVIFQDFSRCAQPLYLSKCFKGTTVPNYFEIHGKM